jgi:hypothetical protein
LGVDGARVVAVGAANPALEVIDQTDARFALEGTTLDVHFLDAEAAEVPLVFVLWNARITDTARLAASEQSSEGQPRNETEDAKGSVHYARHHEQTRFYAVNAGAAIRPAEAVRPGVR